MFPRRSFGQDAPDSLSSYAIQLGESRGPDDTERRPQSNSLNLRDRKFGLLSGRDLRTIDPAPSLPVDNAAHKRRRNSITLSQFQLCGASGIEAQNQTHTTRRQFRVRPPSTKRSTAFGIHVGHVACMCSKEEMIRPNTAAHIAPMTYEGSRRNWTNQGFIGEAMRGETPCCISSRASGLRIGEGAVSSALQHRTAPQPAPIRLLNHLPESVHQGYAPIVARDKATIRCHRSSASASTIHRESVA